MPATRGNLDAEGLLLQIQSGKYVTVYPPDLTSRAKAIWPMKDAPG